MLMKASIFYDFLKLLAIFGLIWAVFYFFPIIPDKDDFQFSIEKEEKLGKVIVEDVLSKDPDFREISDPYLDSVIFVIEERLLQAIGTTDFEYNIRVVENPMVNAFALPGGYIFICSGLIEFSEYPEEVAAVIAHEMGHIEHRHVIAKLIKELGIGILTSGDLTILGEIGRTATSTVFDRKQERDADQFALETLYQANISPRHLGTFFRRLKSKYGVTSENLEIISTHPHINSRIKASLEFDIHQDFKPRGFDVDWDRIKGIAGTDQAE